MKSPNEIMDVLWDSNEISSLEFMCNSLRLCEQFSAHEKDNTKRAIFKVMLNRSKPKSEEYFGVLQAIKDLSFGEVPNEEYREIAEHLLQDPEEYWRR